VNLHIRQQKQGFSHVGLRKSVGENSPAEIVWFVKADPCRDNVLCYGGFSKNLPPLNRPEFFGEKSIRDPRVF